MTKLEFLEFMERTIKPRWPKWKPSNPVVDDWFKICRYHTAEAVDEAIHRHVTSDKYSNFEPKINCIVRLLRARPKGQTQEIVRYCPWIRCLDAPANHPEWEGQEWVRLDGFRRSDANWKDYVAEHAQSAAEEVQAVEGGRWCGICRVEGQAPEGQPELYRTDARKWAIDHVLNGPDGPGRRLLLSGKKLAQSFALPHAVSAPAKTVATRAMLDRLKEEPVAVSGAGGMDGLSMDPKDDEVWEQG